MALPRESAFLPTVKCSSCGRQIEISMMGDHVCSEADADSKFRNIASWSLGGVS